jgi:hypothetical protein
MEKPKKNESINYAELKENSPELNQMRGWDKACDVWEEHLKSLKLCTSPACVKGKVLKEGTTIIIDCPECGGRGFR